MAISLVYYANMSGSEMEDFGFSVSHHNSMSLQAIQVKVKPHLSLKMCELCEASSVNNVVNNIWNEVTQDSPQFIFE